NSAGFDGLILNIHPSPYGSLLIVSGLSASAALAAVISPLIGAYTSDAAFTDSTTAHSFPAASLRPASGNSTYTKSPMRSWASSVMPTVTVPSDSRRTHSWDLVYLRLGGVLLIGFSSGKTALAVSNKRILHDPRLEQLAADINLATAAAR